MLLLNDNIYYFNQSLTNSLNSLPFSSVLYFPSKITTLLKLICLPVPYLFPITWTLREKNIKLCWLVSVFYHDYNLNRHLNTLDGPAIFPGVFYFPLSEIIFLPFFPSSLSLIQGKIEHLEYTGGGDFIDIILEY